MKFTSIPKKLVLTGMSAAMVVAFAPAVAQAAVQDDQGTPTTVEQEKGGLVATLTYKTTKDKVTKLNTHKYYSDATTTDDDALQAALTEAANVEADKGTVKVALEKSVAFDGFTVDNYALPAKTTGAIDSSKGFVIGDDTTLDLGGNTLSESEGVKAPVVTLATGQTTTAKATTEEKTVSYYAKSSAYNDVSKAKADGTQFTFGSLEDVQNGAAESSFKIDQSDAVVYYKATAGAKSYFTADAKDANADKSAKYYKYDAKYTAIVPATSTSIAAASDVTIENGTVTPNKGNVAIEATAATGALTLDKATVTSDGATAVKDTSKNTDVTLTNGTSVTASAEGESVTAVQGKTVTVPYTKAMKDAKASRYDSSAAVSASVTEGKGEAEAIGIDAKTVKTETTATVTAKTDAAVSGNHIGGNGEAKDDEENVPTSIAVEADLVNLGYGNFSGDKAVLSHNGDGYINYGTYDGYVDGNLDIYGGKFKYNPQKNYGKKVDLQDANYVYDYDGYRVAQNGEAGYYYVYRLGKADVEALGNNNRPSDNLKLAAPASAKDANNESYDDANEYVEDKFLNDYTKALVFTEQGYGQKVNDGNLTRDNGRVAGKTVNVYVDGEYLAPTEKAAKAGKYEDQLGYLQAQADANIQTKQGIYRLSAQTKYGQASDEEKSEKVEDVTTLAGAPLDVTAKYVQTNSAARGYKLGATNTEVTLARPQAIGDTLRGTATFNTADTGYYGILVTTSADAQKQAEQNQGVKDAELAKAVSDQIAALPAKVTSSNVEAARKAVADATAGYAQLTADQQKLVTNYGDIAGVQKQIDAIDVANAKTAKATATAKAKTVKGLKVKAGKGKATVSWKAAKGYKYQVKYRQKNSSKTGDFKYKKTSKAKVTLKGLKSKNYYNFKVRAYKKVSGKTVYGKYTSIVTAKVK